MCYFFCFDNRNSLLSLLMIVKISDVICVLCCGGERPTVFLVILGLLKNATDVNHQQSNCILFVTI